MLSIFFGVLLNEHNETWYNLILLDTNYSFNSRLSTELKSGLLRFFNHLRFLPCNFFYLKTAVVISLKTPQNGFTFC